MKYCIVGAGPAGLAVARRFKAAGIPFEIVERAEDLGGVWNISNPASAMYFSTHFISSKPLSEFADFPMPKNFPDYPHHSLGLQYLRSFADKFGLGQHIRFKTEVKKSEKTSRGWMLTFGNDSREEYAGLIVASGFTGEPNFPNIAGTFDGEIIHSKYYKSPKIFEGKRVLVIGAGNSGCDIAIEAAQNAVKTFLSVRRGYHFIPKYVFGKPADQVGEVSLNLGLPLFVRRALNSLLLKAVVGSPQNFGLPKPDHKLLESHPIINSHILQYLGQGDIVPKGDILSFNRKEVNFKDGTFETIDLCVLATGYLRKIPYLDEKYVNWKGDSPGFYLHIFHPEYDDLFIIGMISPDSGVWWLLDEQAQAITSFIQARNANTKEFKAFKQRKADLNQDLKVRANYLPSARHSIEVEHRSYSKKIRKLWNLARS